MGFERIGIFRDQGPGFGSRRIRPKGPAWAKKGIMGKRRFSPRILPAVLFFLLALPGCASIPTQELRLKDPNPEIRAAASTSLGRTRDPRWVPSLIGVLGDPDPHVVQSALSALSQIGDPEVVKSVIPLLGHGDPGVRYVAEQALMEFGSEAVKPLIAALEHRHLYVQEASARILGKLKDRAATVSLLEARSSSHPDRVRIAATKALGELGDPAAVEPLMKDLREKDSPVLHEIPLTLGKIGAPAVLPLIRILADPDEDVARMAAEALGETQDGRAVQPLIEALERGDPFLKRAASDALVAVGEAAVLQLMQRAAAHGENRQEAVDALVRIGPAGLPPLISALESDPFRFGEAALEILPSIGAPAVEPLMALLKGKSSRANEVSEQLLSAMGAPAVPFLTKELKAQDLPTQIRCARALGGIPDDRGAAALVAALESESPELREASADALIRAGKPSISPLIAVMGDPDSPVQSHAQEILTKIGAPAVEPLIQLLKHKDALLTEKTAGLLADIGEPAVPDLIVHLSDPELIVQNRCAEILERIGQPAVFFLAQLVKGPDPIRLWRAVNILGEIGGPDTEQPLSAALGSQNAGVRYLAVEGLEKNPSPEAVSALKGVLADRWVGRRAAEALSRIGWSPGTPEEKLYHGLALGEFGKTSLEKAEAKEALLSDLRGNALPRKAFALHALVGLFGESVIPELVQILQAEGSPEMADLFIDSDSSALQEAACRWVGKNPFPASDAAFGACLLRETP